MLPDVSTLIIMILNSLILINCQQVIKKKFGNITAIKFDMFFAKEITMPIISVLDPAPLHLAGSRSTSISFPRSESGSS